MSTIGPAELIIDPPIETLNRGEPILVPITLRLDTPRKVRCISAIFRGAEETKATYTTTSVGAKGQGDELAKELGRGNELYRTGRLEAGRKCFEEGKPALEAAKKVDLGPYADWKAPARLFMNVERAYREFRGRDPRIEALLADRGFPLTTAPKK